MSPIINPHRYPPPAGGAFSPDDISGLQYWFDADDAASITTTGDDVTQWDDKSGNNLHLDVISGTVQSGTRTHNGKNVIDCGPGHFKRNSTSVPTSMSVYLVAGIDVIDNFNDSLFSVNAGNDFQFEAANSTAYYGRWNQGGIGSNLAPSSVDRKGPATYGLTLNHSTDEVRIVYENAVIASGNNYTGTLDSSQTLRLFANRAGNQNIDGFIAEFIMYDSVLSASDESDVISYLQDKWGVT